MALEEYARKRKFSKTPEPGPSEEAAPQASAGSFFCVQRHDASRLHYDFRLEVGGTLKSWAVPKGPTLDPASKRLAAMVEDHPIDYGSFEGNIPKGNYGAGSVMLWDRGTFELLGDKTAEEQLQRGDFKFRLHGAKLKGEFAIVLMKGRGKGNEWLLLKKKDAEARPGWDVEAYAQSVLTGRTQEEIAKNVEAPEIGSKAPGRHAHANLSSVPGAVRAPMPKNLTPMTSFLTDTPPTGDQWLFEVKWDGIRAIGYIENQKVRLVSRSGISCERQYPELSVIGHQLAAQEVVLDGEIAVLDPKGISSFALIQPRISVTDPNTIAHLARKTPVVYFVFDVMYLDGYDLHGVPLIERKRLLKSILTPSPVLRLSEHFSNNGAEMLAAAQATGLEGILAKNAKSRYESKRSRDWLKLKVVSQQEFVICGFTKGERDYFSSLVLGLYEKKQLVWAGNVGTGFDQKMLQVIYQRLEPLITTRSPFAVKAQMLRDAVWVQPELVCEVKFANWTPEGRLRAPVFLGLRPDKRAEDCVREVNIDAGTEADNEAESAIEEVPAAADSPSEPSPDSRPPLLTGSQAEVSLTVDSRRLKFTNLNKLYFPADGYTKRDLVNFYDAVADLLLPYIKDRPLSLKRYPDGIDHEFFFQKDVPASFASWMRTESIASEHKDKPIRYALCEDRASLLYLANLGCIDQNPWMSRVGSLENPDFILIDLDPQGCEYDKIIEAAQLVRKKLDLVGLEGYPKTTGGDGMHIYVPLEPIYTYEQSRTFAEIIGRLIAAERPDLFTTPRAVASRKQGKVYFDYLQNGESKTIAAPYVVRAHTGAPVATPLKWSEVTGGLLPTQFHIRNAMERFERAGDLFKGTLTNLQRLEEPMDKLAALIQKSAKI